MKKYKNYIIIALAVIAFCVSICFVPIDATRFIPAIESQVTKDLGIKIHIEKLILRFGPTLKVKAPVMHMMYEDGQKFGQFDNVKFFIPWSSLFKNDVVIKRLYAGRLIVKVKSNDKYLPALVEKLNAKDFNETPDVTLKSYSICYYDKDLEKHFKLVGSGLNLAKLVNYKNLSVKTIGEFFINDKKYISYDVSIVPNIEIGEKKDFNINEFIEQMEALDFHSDIIADLKLYKNLAGETQISGLVNIDNISVLDPKKKTPKSFIYLTFLGDKIGVLSNIYASVDKKVYIDGVVNNSKKPSVDLKVKTDEIKLADLYQKVKLFADFSKFKDINSLDGTLKADFSIKGDLNKIKSAGFLNINDAAVKANGLDINKINADVDFSNNVINIVNAVGYVNNAPIMAKGKIDKNIDIELLMNKVELKHLCPVEFGVKNGIASLVANLTGTLENPIHKENLQIENFNAQNKDGNLSFATLKIDTNKNNIAYINNLALKPKATEAIKLPLLKLYIERDSIKVPETNIFMPNSKMTAKAEITNYNSNDLTFSAVVNGFINSRDLKAPVRYSAVYPVKFAINGNRDVQNIMAQVLMDKAFILDEPSLINFVSKLENNTLKIEDLSVSSFNGKLSNDFKANLKGQKKIIVSGNIENLQNAVFKNVRVFVPQQLNVTFMDNVAQLKGDVFVNGKFNKPEIVGQITVQNFINQFLQFGATNMTVDLPLNVNEGKFYSEKALATIYNSPLYLSALNADFKLQNNKLELKNISSEIFNGKLAGSIDFNLKDENFNSRIQARGVSAAPIFDIVSTRKDTISGVMDFDANMQGNLSSKQSLDGDLKFIIHNGRMGTLGKLEHLLYAQNVIADSMLRTSLSVVTKAVTLKDTGLFKYLRGDITMKNGIANVKMLQSQGPLMTLFIKGQYNPVTDYAKLVVLGRLSDEVVSGLGAFGDFSFNKLMVMLTGEDTKYNLLPEDFEKLPPLPTKNTKEFRSVINGIVDKPSSVLLFNWISYTQKSYRQKDVPMTDVKVPDFIESLPY